MADQILNNAQIVINKYSDLNNQTLNQLVKDIPLPNEKIYCEAFRLENKNIKIAIELLSKFSHSALKNIKWQNQDLFNVANKFDKNTKNSAIFILKKYSPSWTDILTENIKKNMEQYIGKFTNANHGLNLLNKIYIPNLHEPQVTEGLTQCLNSGDKIKNYNKVLCFLKALRVSEDFVEKKFIKIADQKNCNLVVKPEVKTKNNKRIDILISWTSSGKYYGVAIEAKFDHKVTVGQLQAYEEYCLEKKMERFELILLTKEGDQNSKHKNWKALSWLSLLVRLEKSLDEEECKCDDYIFTCFRAMVWKKIRGV